MPGASTRGASLAALGRLLCRRARRVRRDFDLLFGPAYKGIPLATALACATPAAAATCRWPSTARKPRPTAKAAALIGAPLAGRRVLIVDDVITAGTAIREALAIIRDGGGTPAAIVIALDREEVIDARCTRAALGRAGRRHRTRDPRDRGGDVSDLLAFAGQSAELVADHARLVAYRQAYGCQAG